MATLAQIRTKANNKLATFWTTLQEKQDAYYAKHNKYFQLLVSPLDAVVDGLDSDYVVRVPNDEQHVADRTFSFTEKIPFQIRVDEWTGETAGYTATVTVELLDGRQFRRSRGSDGADTDWFEIATEQIPVALPKPVKPTTPSADYSHPDLTQS